MKKKVLFVCTGNTCRSSMAEAIALNLISENKDKYGEIWVTSAGTNTLSGLRASENAIKVAKEKGIDLENFRSKPISPELIKEVDIILTMTNSHKQQLLQLFPEAKDKVFLLKEFILDYERKEDHLKKVEELYQKIKEKEDNFLDKYKDNLLKLERRKRELEEELDKVITELGNWQVKLYEETREERLKLEKLEKELKELEISDPYGQPVDIYRKCYQDLYEAIKKALEKIRRIK